MKATTRLLLGDYSCYRIFVLDLEQLEGSWPLPAWLSVRAIDAEELASLEDEGLRQQAAYGGFDAWGFGALVDGHLVAVQWIWGPERYKERGYWPLAAGEAKSVSVYVVPPFRGRGIGPLLKRWSAERLREAGVGALYSRVWCTNLASVRMQEKTGCRQIARVIEVNPLRGPRPWRFVLRF